MDQDGNDSDRQGGDDAAVDVRPSVRRRPIVKPVLLAIVVPVLLMATLVVGLQRRLIFPLRSAEASTPSRGWTASEIGGGLHAWSSKWSPGRRTAIMFHGNAVMLGAMAFVADAWVRDGWNVVLVEFPGYDGNPGHPTSGSIADAGASSWEWAARHGSTRTGTVVVANSIGTGPAADLVGKRDPAGFLVVSGVDDMAEVVREQVPFVPSFLVFDRMMSADAIRSYRGWTRVWHAPDDSVVPFSQGLAIARSAGTAVVRRAGGHQLFWDADLQTELRREAARIVPSRRPPTSR
jgi:hypothetical protein